MKKTTWLTIIISMMFAMAAIAQPSVQTLITNGLAEPYGVAVDLQNNHYISDSANNRILKYNPDSGSITNVAGSVEEAGFADGRGVFARFFNPQGLVYTRGGIAVADSGNHRIRFVTLAGVASTLAGTGEPGSANGPGGGAQFNAPAGLAADAAGNIYVADLGNNSIRRIDLANNVTTFATGFARPAGVAVDRNTGVIYVADTDNHSIKTIQPDGTVALLAGSGSRFISGKRDSVVAANALFNKPRGLLWVGGNSGLIVSDTDNQQIRRVFFNTNDNVFSVDTLADSPLMAKPIGLARDENGNIPFADLGRNALLRVQLTAAQPPVSAPQIGFVILEKDSFGQPVTSLQPVVDSTFNNDVMVAVLSERGTTTFYTLDPNADFPNDPNSRSTPLFYENGLETWDNTIVYPSLDGPVATVRAISTQEGRKSSTNVTAIFRFNVAATTINGKNPGAFTLTNITENAELWYTVDGSIPTNGPPARPYVPGSRLNIVNGTNNVIFTVGAFRQGYAPSFVSRTFLYDDLQTSTIGITRDFNAGIGSTIVVPVDVKLSTEDSLQSLQFRVEITPLNGAPSISTQLRNLVITTNDFIQLPLPSTNAPLSSVYTNGSNTGLSVAYVGNGNGLELSGSGVAALIAVPIPPAAQEGQSYRLDVLEPSGTSDGSQASVRLTPFSSRTILVTNIAYIVGDTAPAAWYNQGDFGDGNLSNNDVNSAFYASLGLFTPYSFSDVFDAMDAFPEDTSVSVGGDGQIRFLDWQLILQRSLRRSTNNWTRSWAAGGARVATRTTLSGAASLPGIQLFKGGDAGVWSKEATLSAAPVENAAPGLFANVPVYVTVDTDYALAGLQFRAAVTGNNGAPALSQPVRFVPAVGQATAITLLGGTAGLAVHEASAGWPLVPQPSFNPALQNKVLLGHVVVAVPASAQAGQSYSVHFSNVDGAPNLSQQYSIDSIRASIWVGTTAQAPAEVISDEWKIAFFGSVSSPLAAPGADPDEDGLDNATEFAVGSHPAELHLKPANGSWASAASGITIRWLGLPGFQYRVERTADFQAWTTVTSGLSGSGSYQEFNAASTGSAQFYRVVAQP